MRRLLTLGLLAITGASLSAQNWPSFRGPNASGVADGKPTAVTWNVAAGENVAWKTPVAGVAVSSPIVWGDRVFVSTAVSSDPAQGIRTGLYGDVEPVADASKHTWHLIAIDKKTGKVIWEQMAVQGKVPALALVVTVSEAFIHCGKCMIRSGLWAHEAWPAPDHLPSQARCLVDHGGLSETVEEVQASIEEARRTRLY